MAASNTKFKIEHGLDVVGSANVSGTLRVEGDLVVSGNLASALNVTGDFKPTANHTYSLGNTTLRWTVVGSSADFSNTLNVTGATTLSDLTVANVVANANNNPLGSTTKRFNLWANTANVITAEVGTLLTVYSNSTVNTLKANATHVAVIGQVSINTGSKSAVVATGNTTYSNLVLTNDVTTVEGNVTFDTDLMFLDASNNRVGIKNTAPSNAAVLTIGGNVETSTANVGFRFNGSNATMNASVVMIANSTNSRFTFTTYDQSNSSIQDGGYQFNTTTAAGGTTSLLTMNGYEFKYKTSNVVHQGNFGIYDVSGTRVGP